MISNPDLVYYACIARETTILAHRTSKDPKIEDLAVQCLARAPPNHSMFSHTVRKRTYTFSIDAPFVYFAIFDEQLLRTEALWFLNHIKTAFRDAIKSNSLSGSDDFAPLCFQAQFDSILREAMASGSDSDSANSSRGGGKDCRDPSVESSRVGKRSATVPLLEKPAVEGLKKKKRMGMEANGMDPKDAAAAAAMENKVDVCDDVNGCARDFSLAVPKGMVNDRHKAKQIWKKHVWVVLLLDVFVCAILFVIWLWVCSGFRCMAY